MRGDDWQQDCVVSAVTLTSINKVEKSHVENLDADTLTENVNKHFLY